MVDLNLLNIDDQTVANLRARAARHGVSMEEEIRQILRNAATSEQLGGLAVRLFSPAYGNEELVLEERQTSKPIKFA